MILYLIAIFLDLIDIHKLLFKIIDLIKNLMISVQLLYFKNRFTYTIYYDNDMRINNIEDIIDINFFNYIIKKYNVKINVYSIMTYNHDLNSILLVNDLNKIIKITDDILFIHIQSTAR